MSRQKPIIQIDAKKQKELGILSDLRSVRPSVYRYAKKLEQRLREKDKEKGRDGWHDGRFYYYLYNVRGCYNKLVNILQLRNINKLKDKDIHLAIKKCVDGGNFLMMLVDNLRDELLKRGVRLHK
jgi:hypothetical protein